MYVNKFSYTSHHERYIKYIPLIMRGISNIYLSSQNIYICTTLLLSCQCLLAQAPVLTKINICFYKSPLPGGHKGLFKCEH